jgi:hypothetical protein
VKYYCDSTAIEDIASAIGVFDFYCSAARADVTAIGITESIAQAYPTASAGNLGGGGGGGAKPTTTDKATGTDRSSSTAGAANGGGSADGNGGPKTAVIAGVIAGVVVALIGVGALIWFLVKQSRKKQADAAALAATNANLQNQGPDYNGKPELAGNPINPPHSPSPSMLKAHAGNRVETISPVSAHGSAWTPPPSKAELHGQGAPYPPMPPNAAELAGQGQQGSLYMPPNRPELMGAPGYPMPPHRPELMGQQPAGYPTSPNRPELMGQQDYPQGYQQGQGYPMRAQEYNGYNNGQQYHQEAYGQPVYEFPGQTGPYQQPVHEAHSRPVTGHGQQQHQQQSHHDGWGPGPMAELDGRYGQGR